MTKLDAIRYSPAKLAEAKATGLTPYELSMWNIRPKHDEVIAYHTPRPSLVPPGVQRLAQEMLLLALEDLRKVRPPGYRWPQARSYWPDPEGARDWFEACHDRPLSAKWCCQILRLDHDAVREAVRKGPSRPQDQRTDGR